jgi:hypothetical protein
MICPKCHGSGAFFVWDRGDGLRPCLDCGGRGRINCCEGEQAQPGEPYDYSQHAFGDGMEHTVDVKRIKQDLGIDE